LPSPRNFRRHTYARFGHVFVAMAVMVGSLCIATLPARAATNPSAATQRRTQSTYLKCGSGVRVSERQPAPGMQNPHKSKHGPRKSGLPSYMTMAGQVVVNCNVEVVAITLETYLFYYAHDLPGGGTTPMSQMDHRFSDQCYGTSTCSVTAEYPRCIVGHWFTITYMTVVWPVWSQIPTNSYDVGRSRAPLTGDCSR